jgi:hypothetical protein
VPTNMPCVPNPYMVANDIDSLSWEHGMVRAAFVRLHTCARSFRTLPSLRGSMNDCMHACMMETDGKCNGRARGILLSRPLPILR